MKEDTMKEEKYHVFFAQRFGSYSKIQERDPEYLYPHTSKFDQISHYSSLMMDLMWMQ